VVSMKKTTKKMTIAFVVIVVIAVLVLVGYYIVNQMAVSKDNEAETLPKTEVGKLEAKDLELKYPGTPTEVVKLYWRLNQCIYNTTMKDKDLEALLKQLRMLYDDELLDEDGNSYDDMLASLKEDREKFTKDKRFISSYVVEEDKYVEYATVDGKECATLNTNTLETVDKKTTQTYEKFMCRKDSDGKWKIVGWEITDASEESQKDDK
jgi:hypothetical protein